MGGGIDECVAECQGRESEGEEGCEEQGRLEGTYIEGAQMRGVRAGSGKVPEVGGGGALSVFSSSRA